MNTVFTIHNTEIAIGQHEIVKIPVGRIPSGTQLSIKAHVYRSQQEGPCALVLGGVHGDEINGVEIVRRAVEENLFSELKKGSVIAIPLLNVYGFINYSRDVPDGKDVNRSFPGRMTGSLASRIARTLTKKILPYVDFGIDFHTGGQNNYNFPQIRFTKGHEGSAELAEAFHPPFILTKPPIPKSLRKISVDMDKPMLVFEGGENLRYDGFSISHGLDGLKRVLYYKGMYPDNPKSESTIWFEKSSWLRAPKAGMFRWIKSSGQQIRRGELLGAICDPFGMDQMDIFADREGYIVGHNNGAVVNQGDALFHIGF